MRPRNISKRINHAPRRIIKVITTCKSSVLLAWDCSQICNQQLSRCICQFRAHEGSSGRVGGGMGSRDLETVIDMEKAGCGKLFMCRIRLSRLLLHTELKQETVGT